MQTYRISAVIRRHLLLTFRVFHRIIDVLYWPFLNIVLWGFNSVWHQQVESPVITFTLLTALIFWQILFRANMEICYSLLDELQSQNFCNLFSSPLLVSEWMVAVIAIGLCKAVFTFIFGATCIWLLYALNILSIGWSLVPFLALIILVGWSVGFLTGSCIITWGQNVQGLMWVVVWAFVPISGIFFPVSILPQWMQYCAYCFPQVYIFEGLRSFIISGVMPSAMMIKGTIISIFFLVLSLCFFKYRFETSKIYGFSRLERYE